MNASLVDSVPFVNKVLAGQPVAGNCATVVKPPPPVVAPLLASQGRTKTSDGSTLRVKSRRSMPMAPAK